MKNIVDKLYIRNVKGSGGRIGRGAVYRVHEIIFEMEINTTGEVSKAWHNQKPIPLASESIRSPHSLSNALLSNVIST